MRVFGQLAFIIFLIGSFLAIRHKVLLDLVKTSDVVLLVFAIQLFALSLLADLIISTKRS
jgi:hypothetical protein